MARSEESQRNQPVASSTNKSHIFGQILSNFFDRSFQLPYSSTKLSSSIGVSSPKVAAPFLFLPFLIRQRADCGAEAVLLYQTVLAHSSLIASETNHNQLQPTQEQPRNHESIRCSPLDPSCIFKCKPSDLIQIRDRKHMQAR